MNLLLNKPKRFSPGKPRAFQLIVSLLLGLALAAVSGTPAALAHSSLLRADPPISSVIAPDKLPTRITLWFNEQPDLTYSRLQVAGPDGLMAGDGKLQLDPADPNALFLPLVKDLPEGVYNVSWKVISLVDRHLTEGKFSFGIGPAGSSTQLGLVKGAGLVSARPGSDATNLSIWSVVSRWLNYLAMALLVGCSIFALLIWFPFSIDLKSEERFEGKVLAEVREKGWQHLGRLAALSLGLLLVGWLFGLGYQFSIEAGISPLDPLNFGTGAFAYLLKTSFGNIWLVRLGFILAAGFIYLFCVRLSNKNALKYSAITGSTPDSQTNFAIQQKRFLWWGALAGSGIFILLTTSLNSHAASNPAVSIFFAVTIDWLHLAAVSIWLGGVASLVLILAAVLAAAKPGSGNRTKLITTVLGPFSKLILSSVIALIVTGLVASMREIDSLTTLLTTWYGQALLIKVGLFVFTLFLGAGAFLVIQPRLAGFAWTGSAVRKGPGSPAAGRLIFQFRQIIVIESILLVVVLVSVGVLTSLAPPRNTPVTTAQSGPSGAPGPAVSPETETDLELSGTAGDYRLDMIISPAEVGPNNFMLYVLDNRSGQPVADFKTARLQYSSDGGTLINFDLENATSIAPGFYQGVNELLTKGGKWQMKVILQKPGVSDVEYTFEFEVKG
ncbi:MAG: copper resistance protein CopC/CopD [Chloroflexi bacterium]|nr:copper resistance protein CopC/CopD [Chloroflexota bacterium]OJV99081.1 MAG: hypothetical protein BGO39_16600 [Chloroflexi bacterium 54-19]